MPRATYPGLLCAFLCVSHCFAAAPQSTLPDGVIPLRHAIELTIDPAQDHFTGIARIDVRFVKPQTEIWLNGRDLNVEEAWVEVNNQRISVTPQLAGGEFIGLTLPQALAAREATVVIRYRAPLSAESSTGPYHAKTGEDWYVFTTFTPTDARRAFPCFDEPRFKTAWSMSLRIPAALRGFANAPQIAEERQQDGSKILRFAETRPLPAEVVAFAVGPFDVWEGRPAGLKAIPIRVLTARGQAKEGEVAARETMDILPRLERYTGIPYPWEKLDHVTLPRSAFGAVENPGLITYNGRSLLADPAAVDDTKRRAIRGLQAHEIGHQWFGNLVTQASWTDVWLSEGFATWFSARIMDEEQPADRRNLSFAVARENIMRVDDGPQTRTVRLERQTRQDLQTVYSRVVYQKGGSLLLMLENWLGADRMQTGLRDYLAAHAFHNTTTQELESALQIAAASQVKASDLASVMNGYLNTTGVPKISADVHCEGIPSLEITRTEGKTPVPVCWRLGSMQSCTVVVATSRVTLPGAASCPAVVYPNSYGAGYYRVSWTPEQMTKLQTSLNALQGAERLTLIYDLQASRTANPPRELDTLLQTLANDKQPEVAHAAKVALGLEKEEPRPRLQ